uniref:Uncharacterized protein n=1 Tax=viral metagenome TaxID=1070528 RepID=A0A6C0CA76_9ZZZZ
MDAVVVGSFIVQCLLNETWDHNICDIYTMMPGTTLCLNYSDSEENWTNNSDIKKFMKDKGYYVSVNLTSRYDNQQNFINLSPVKCHVNQFYIYLFSLHHNTKPISINQYVHNYTQHDVHKNMYKFATGELYVHDMHGIFTKRTNWSRSKKSVVFYDMHRQGFTFYKSGSNSELMTNDDILRSKYNIIRIRDKGTTKITNCCEYYIQDSMIHLIRQYGKYDTDVIFDIVEMSAEKYQCLYICKCECSEWCIMRLLYPMRKHYHGRYKKRPDLKEIILMFDQ